MIHFCKACGFRFVRSSWGAGNGTINLDSYRCDCGDVLLVVKVIGGLSSVAEAVEQNSVILLMCGDQTIGGAIDINLYQFSTLKELFKSLIEEIL